ncbi:HAD family hydrolase [Patescibacteria group bacterium]
MSINHPKSTSMPSRAAEHVFNTLGVNQENFPRLANALKITSNREDLRLALDALEKDPAAPVLIMHQNLEEELRTFPDLGLSLQYPNVRTVPVVQAILALQIFNAPKQDGGQVVDFRKSILAKRSRFRHDIGNAIRGGYLDKQQSLIGEVREELDLKGDNQAIIDEIMKPDEAVEVDEYFDIDALCIDWDGTLSTTGQFNLELFERAKEEAQQKGLPLVIWTGGNVDRVYKFLKAQGIDDVNVCSKSDCKGLRVTAAIDDESLEDLKFKYGVDVKEFEQVQSGYGL